MTASTIATTISAVTFIGVPALGAPGTAAGDPDNDGWPTLAELQSILLEDKKAKGYEADCGQWVKTVKPWPDNIAGAR